MEYFNETKRKIVTRKLMYVYNYKRKKNNYHNIIKNNYYDIARNNE